jgi:hypothetical protein
VFCSLNAGRAKGFAGDQHPTRRQLLRRLFGEEFMSDNKSKGRAEMALDHLTVAHIKEAIVMPERQSIQEAISTKQMTTAHVAEGMTPNAPAAAQPAAQPTTPTDAPQTNSTQTKPSK